MATNTPTRPRMAASAPPLSFANETYQSIKRITIPAFAVPVSLLVVHSRTPAAKLTFDRVEIVAQFADYSFDYPKLGSNQAPQRRSWARGRFPTICRQTLSP